jgi:hypothetical protein
MSRTLKKAAVVLIALAGLGYLFVRSVEESRSEPYVVSPAEVSGWTVAIEIASSPASPMLVLRPRPSLAGGLFRQVFSRAGETLSGPASPGIPLVLQNEFQAAFAGRVSPEALADAARGAGLESTPIQPQCLGYRRVSDPGITRQLYFVLFDAPAFDRFRREIATKASAAAIFDPAAQSPVLFVAGADTAFDRWLPFRAEPETDCVASVAVR